jgi:acyl-CoA synthetase (AMP-forming)/AMP-acid ligase II
MRTSVPECPLRPVLPDLLRRAASRWGDADYVVLADRRLSFREADEASADLAKHMLSAGIGKGTRVAIVLPTGIEWVVAWLATARIGALPMLIPATSRPGELRRVLRISDASLLIAPNTMLGEDYEALLEQAVPSLDTQGGPRVLDSEVPYLRAVWIDPATTKRWATALEIVKERRSNSEISDELLRATELEVSPADPLLVIYTSGSAADPKGVMHTHGAAIRKVQPELGMCLPGSYPGRTFCAMPFFWVGGPQNLLGALYSGAAVVAQERFDAEEALELLERECCTSLIGWASVYEQLQSHPTWSERDLDALNLPSQQTQTSSRGHPRNLGMTETFGPHANPDWFEYRVVDQASGEDVVAGEEGEFCIRGFGVTYGLYKVEREETFDRDGWFHTGDLGYIEDGSIWFTGRLGEMIKSRGSNVSPLEVEQTLLGDPSIAAAVVLGVSVGDEEIVAAVVVPAPDAQIEIEDLSQRLRTELSAYKVPKRWLVLSAADLPELANGKTDKRKLREWLKAGLDTGGNDADLKANL